MKYKQVEPKFRLGQVLKLNGRFTGIITRIRVKKNIKYRIEMINLSGDMNISEKKLLKLNPITEEFNSYELCEFDRFTNEIIDNVSKRLNVPVKELKRPIPIIDKDKLSQVNDLRARSGAMMSDSDKFKKQLEDCKAKCIDEIDTRLDKDYSKELKEIADYLILSGGLDKPKEPENEEFIDEHPLMESFKTIKEAFNSNDSDPDSDIEDDSSEGTPFTWEMFCDTGMAAHYEGFKRKDAQETLKHGDLVEVKHSGIRLYVNGVHSVGGLYDLGIDWQIDCGAVIKDIHRESLTLIKRIEG